MENISPGRVLREQHPKECAVLQLVDDEKRSYLNVLPKKIRKKRRFLEDGKEEPKDEEQKVRIRNLDGSYKLCTD